MVLTSLLPKRAEIFICYFFVICALLCGLSLSAATFTATSTTGGNWNDGGSWGNASPGVEGTDFPSSAGGDIANLPGGTSITIPAGYAANVASLTLNSDQAWASSSLSLADATSSLSLSGNLDMNAPPIAPSMAIKISSITMNGGTMSVGGNLTATAIGTEIYGMGKIYNQLIATGGGTLSISGNTSLTNGGSANATAKINMNTAGSTLSMSGSVNINVLDNGAGTNGEIIYNGAGSQTILSSITYYDLTVSGVGLKTLNGNTSIRSSLTMAGKIDMAGSTLILGIDAFTPGNLFYTSGYMYGGGFKRWFLGPTTIADGSTEGLFPMGDDVNYRPFFVSRPVAGSDGGTITVSHTDATTVSDVSFPDGAGTVARRHDSFWSCVTGDGLNGGTFNLRVEGTGFGTIGDVDDLRLTHVGSTVGTAGTNAGTTGNPQINREGLTLAELSNSFYVGSVNAGNSPLPIGLLYFNAIPADHKVEISWATASETNNDYFTVERTKDGYAFETLPDTIPGAGNSIEKLSYKTCDEAPMQGTSYYRLKQTDVNGDFSYSALIAVRIRSDKEQFLIFPNPVAGNHLYIYAEGMEYNDMIVDIYDSMGKTAISGPLLEGIIALTLYKQLIKGIYYIVISNSKGILHTEKIVIK